MTRFVRTRQLLGDARMERLRNARVGVFGLGAVGSYAVEALARAGVGNLRLVDFDTIKESNVNRQLYALDSTIGMEKTAAAKQRVLDINPRCVLDVRQEFIDETSVGTLCEPPLDVLVDAIDSVSSKVHLIRESLRRGIFTVSSMGAAARLDAGAITVADLSETYNCPLARMIRKRLHRHGIRDGVRCVFSPENALNKLPPVDAPDEHDHSRPGRKRSPVGSISCVTGMFGLRAAAEAIGYIIGG